MTWIPVFSFKCCIILLSSILMVNSLQVADGETPYDIAWIRQLRTTGHVHCDGVAADAEGNSFITGYTEGSLAGPNAGGHDAYVAKYDTAGNLLWVRQLGSSGWDDGESVATDAEGNVFIVGSTLGSLGGPNAGAWDVFVAKYDSSGNFLWIRQFGTLGGDLGFGVTTDTSGNVIICGGIAASIFVRKYDGSGNLIWVRQVNSFHGDFAYAVAVDTTGNIFFCGDTFGSLGGPSGGSLDVVAGKYTASGDLLWIRQYGTSSYETASAIAVDAAGNAFVSGYFSPPNSGIDNVLVLKYDSVGNLVWSRTLGTSADDESYGVAVDAPGNIFVSGRTLGSLSGVNAGGWDAFVSKYDTLGNLLWTRQIGTQGHDETYGGVAVDGGGNVFISGWSSDDIDGTTPHDNLYDSFLIKFTALPQLLELAPTLDALANFSNGGSSVVDGETVINVQHWGAVDRRGVLEFNIGAIPDAATIDWAAIDLDIAVITTSGNKYPALYLHGYAGNGTLEVADGQVPANLVGQSGPVADTGRITINLDAAYIQPLLSSTNYLGLLAVGDDNGKQAGFVTIEGAIPGVRYAPKLRLQYRMIYPSQIRGSQFYDLNRNGARNEGELGLEGWTVYADLNANGQYESGEPSAVTDANGDYAITHLTPGTYTVREVMKEDWVQTFPGGTGGQTVAVGSAQSVNGVNFGNRRQSSIDSDGDALPDAWESTNGLTVGILDSFVDADKDGPTNFEEWLRSSDPHASPAPAMSFVPGALLATQDLPRDVAAGDFNRDGHVDIAVLTASTLEIRLGLGDGTFGPATVLVPQTRPGSAGVQRVAVGDFNWDGYLDLAVTSDSQSSCVEVFLGGAGGSFVTSYYSSVLWFASSELAVADFNRDGFQDLLIHNQGQREHRVLSGNGDGTFIYLAFGYNAYSLDHPVLVVADLDEDGDTDFLTAGSGHVTVRLNEGYGAFGVAWGGMFYDGFAGVTGGSPIDYNHDGHIDLALYAGATVAFETGDGLGGFTIGPSISVEAAGSDLATLDFNGDGFTDIAIVTATNKLGVLISDAVGGFLPIQYFPLPFAPLKMTVADFNHDGMQDVLIASSSDNSVVLMQGAGVNEVWGRIILGDYTADVTTVPITVEVLSNPPESHTIFLNSDQHYSFTTGRSGIYDIIVKAPHWLTRKAENVTIGANPVDFTLINGDCDGNNAVESTDLSILLEAMDRVGSDPMADLDGDGAVTSADLTIVLSGMDQTGEE